MSTSTRRLVQLYAGLVLFGVSVAFFVQARLGLDPWDVFHQGLADRTNIRIGTVAIAVGVAVLLLWIPLRQRPGLGTVSNVILVGLTLDLALVVLPEAGPMAVRVAFLLIAIGMNAVATGLYIGAGLGPGPRDGLMTGLARRGYSIRVVRTTIELAVLAIGWLLGGTVGVGTALFALSIGPLVHVTIPLFAIEKAPVT
jgi:uncharacterized membrane protein YczE